MGDPRGLGYGPALKAGAIDMISPGGLFSLLFFLTLLFYSVRNHRDILRVGLSFIFANACIKIFLVFGFCDSLLFSFVFRLAAAHFYLFLAGFFIFVGVALFLDWMKTVKSTKDSTSKFLIRIPLLLREKFSAAQDEKKPFFSFRSFFLGAVWGFIQGLWGNDVNFFLIFLQQYSPVHEPPIFSLFLVYALMAEFLLILSTGISWFYSRGERYLACLRMQLTKVQLFLSALFLSCGISFLLEYGWEFIRMYQNLLT